MHRLFFYLLIFFLPSQLGYHFWPAWSMVLGRRVDYLSPTLFLTDILILLTFCSFVIPNLFRDLKTNVYKMLTRRFGGQHDKILLVVIGYGILNLFFAQEPHLAIYGWFKILEYYLLFLYIKRTAPSFSKVFSLLSLTVIYSCIIGIAQMLWGGSIGGVFWFLGERSFSLATPNIAKGVLCFPSLSCIEFLRPYATFSHPNVLAGFLAFYIFLALQQRKMLLMILPALTLLLTFSRSAWLALAIVLFFTFKPVNHLAIKISLFIILFVITLSPLPFLNHESIDVRIALNQSSLAIIKNFPLLGVGVKNFLVALPSFLPSRTIYFLQPVHSIYLLLLSEIGLIGILGLLFIFKKYVSLLNSYLLLLLFLGLFDHYLLTLQQGQLLLLVALAFPHFHRE